MTQNHLRHRRQIDGADYVTVAQVGAFYGFNNVEATAGAVFLRSGRLAVEFHDGVEEMLVNLVRIKLL